MLSCLSVMVLQMWNQFQQRVCEWNNCMAMCSIDIAWSHLILPLLQCPPLNLFFQSSLAFGAAV